jgi:hypothetical protein
MKGSRKSRKGPGIGMLDKIREPGFLKGTGAAALQSEQ